MSGKLVEIENDDGLRKSEAGRQVKKRNQHDHPDTGVDHKCDDAKGTKTNWKTKENVRMQRDKTK